MNKYRLEALSDGVLAIVITLLILNVRLPEVSYEQLSESLESLLPTVLVYVMSFMLIGMYWVFHHFTLNFVKEVDGIILWGNILFLLFISFLPFPTMLIGKYPYQTLPLVIYGANLLLANLTGFIMVIYLRRNPQLHHSTFTDKVYASQMRVYLGVNICYLCCMAMAFWHAKLSLYLFVLIAIFLIIRTIVFTGIGKCNPNLRAAQTIPEA